MSAVCAKRRQREVFAKWGDRGLPSLKGVTPSKSSLNLSSQLIDTKRMGSPDTLYLKDHCEAIKISDPAFGRYPLT